MMYEEDLIWITGVCHLQNELSCVQKIYTMEPNSAVSRKALLLVGEVS